MPLSKKRNKERMRIARCATYVQPKVVQPNKAKIAELKTLISNHQPVQPKVLVDIVPDIDADGNRIYE